MENVDVIRGTVDTLAAYAREFSAVVSKGKIENIEIAYDIPESVTAPIERGAKIGKVTYKLDDICIGESDVYTNDSADEIQIWDLILRLLRRMLCG